MGIDTQLEYGSHFITSAMDDDPLSVIHFLCQCPGIGIVVAVIAVRLLSPEASPCMYDKEEILSIIVVCLYFQGRWGRDEYYPLGLCM